MPCFEDYVNIFTAKSTEIFHNDIDFLNAHEEVEGNSRNVTETFISFYGTCGWIQFEYHLRRKKRKINYLK